MAAPLCLATGVERIVMRGGTACAVTKPSRHYGPDTGRRFHMSNLREALVDEIRDLYHAEKQLIRALPKLSKGASSPDLREALDSHLEETEQHVARLEEVFEHLGERVRAKTCPGMAGIVEEGSDMLGEDFEEEVMDAAIIAAAQRAEHYEMAAYGTAAAWAKALGMGEVADLLTETLEEEKSADEKLSRLAEQGINAAASAGNGQAMDGMDEGESAMAATSPRRGNGRSSTAARKRR
jgi:ferritin-like metal-binding protein YciE